MTDGELIREALNKEGVVGPACCSRIIIIDDVDADAFSDFNKLFGHICKSVLVEGSAVFVFSGLFVEEDQRLAWHFFAQTVEPANLRAFFLKEGAYVELGDEEVLI